MDLIFTREIIFSRAFKKDKLDLIKKGGKPHHIWENGGRIDIGGCPQFKRKEAFITFCNCRDIGFPS